MSKLRVGLIGAGAIGRDHCRGVNKHPDAEMAAVADLSRKRASAIKKEFLMGKSYTDWRDLVANPDIDAVAIALPNALHASVALAAIKAGKHVLMDKPFATSLREAEKVVDAAKDERRVVMVGMNQRYRTESQTIRALVERGDLGDVYHAQATWLRRAGSPKFGTWFCRKDMAGGGCLYDIGVHMLDLCLYLMDQWRPTAVSGATYTKFGNRGIGEGGWGHSDADRKRVFDVDDFSSALIKLRGGATIQLNVSWVAHQAQANVNDVQLFGTEAGASTFPARLFRFGKQKGEYEVVEPQGVKIARPGVSRQADWVDAVLGNSKPMCTLKQALAVQKILDAIYKSSKTGREVRL